MGRIINMPIDLERAIVVLSAEDGPAACDLLLKGLKDHTDAEAALDRARLSRAKAKAKSPAEAKREAAARIAARDRVVAREEVARAATKLKSDIARLSPATLAKAKAKGLTPAQLIAKRDRVKREGGAL